MLYWKKELEMLSSLLKTFGMKEVKVVVYACPCDGDMAKTNTTLFQLGREVVISEKSNRVETGPGANSSCT